MDRGGGPLGDAGEAHRTKKLLWDLIGRRDLSEQGFSMLTGQRLSPAWGRVKTNRHFQTSTTEALKGYYRMWLETDFSAKVRQAKVETPFLVIGGRQDLPGFQEEHLRRAFGAWYPNAELGALRSIHRGGGNEGHGDLEISGQDNGR